MARRKHQKIKILRVMDHIKASKGESQALTIKQLCQMLLEEEIPCDRRTLTDDIDILTEYINENPNYDFVILSKNTARGKAFYSELKPKTEPRIFTDNELLRLICGLNSLKLTEDVPGGEVEALKNKLTFMSSKRNRKKMMQYAQDENIYALDTAAAKILIDSVNSFTFMKSNTTDRIINTIIKMSDNEDQPALAEEKNNPAYRQYSSKNITLYEIDTLFRAIDRQTKISFRYFDLDENRNQIYRHDGKEYVVEPLTLTPNDDHYYLICYDKDTEGFLRTYRIDRMTDVSTECCEEPISDEAKEMAKCVWEHTNSVFRMYRGPVRTVTLEFSNKIIGNVFDKFGPEAKITRIDENTCSITEEIQISPPFLGWLFQFSGNMKIVSPQDVIEQYKDRCNSALQGTI